MAQNKNMLPWLSSGKATERRKKYRNNPFLIAFICFALIICLALDILFLSILYEHDNDANRHFYQEKANTMLNDFCTQLDRFESLTKKFIIDEKYMYFKVFENKYHEYILLEDFARYKNHSFLTEHMFLYYRGSSSIFNSSGNTVFQDVFFEHLTASELQLMHTVLNTTDTGTTCFALGGRVYILIPFKAGYGMGAPKAILGSVLTGDVLESRLALVGDQIEGSVAIYYHGTLLYCNDDAACDENAGNAVIAVSPGEEFTLRYIPEQGYLYSLINGLQVVLILLVTLMILWLAFMFADSVYQPFHKLSKKYTHILPVSDKAKSENIYGQVEGIIDAALKTSLTSAMEVEQKQELLKQHILKSILNGAYLQDVATYLEQINILLPGPFYYVISVVFQEDIDETSWDFMQKELRKTASSSEQEYLCTVGEYKTRELWILCSLGEQECEESLTERIQEVVGSDKYSAAVGVGNVYQGLQKLHASWLESMDALYGREESVDQTCPEYSYKDLQWLPDVLSNGNEQIALAALQKYVQWIRANIQSMLMQLYTFSEFVGVLAHQCSANGIKLSKQVISLILSARTTEAFYEAASEAIVEYCQQLKSLAKEKTENKAHQICAYIQEHFMEFDLSIDTIANAMNVQGVEVRAAVYKVVGKKYTDYVTELRMEYAKKLLSEQELSVAEICEAVGYSSVSYFIRIFKETTGTTPGKYIKEKL